MIHQFTDQQDTVSTPFFLIQLILHGRHVIAIGIERFTLVDDGYEHFIATESQLNMDRFAGFPLVCVLDDVGAGLVHGQYDIIDIVFAKTKLAGMIRNEMADSLQLIGRSADAQSMFLNGWQSSYISQL